MANRSYRTPIFLGGLGIGAGLMLLFDPVRGRSRRARATDLSRHYWRKGKSETARATRDAWHRTQGMVARARHFLERGSASPTLIHARVRTRIGRLVSHPHAIGVEVFGNTVRLSGPVFADEGPKLLAGVARVPGVARLENALVPHQSAEHIPALQGERFRPRGHRLVPAAKLAVGVTPFLALGLWGRRAVGITALGAGTLFLGLRALEAERRSREGDEDIGWSPRSGLADGEINLYRQFQIHAPLEKVYRFWRNLEELPNFISHLEEVTEIAPGRYQWKILREDGPMEWITDITREIPNQLLSWRSEPGAPISQNGMIHLEAHPRGGTRMHLRVTYRRPEGAVDLKAEELFGPDPRRVFEEDCRRVKSYLERGIPPLDTAERPAIGE